MNRSTPFWAAIRAAFLCGSVCACALPGIALAQQQTLPGSPLDTLPPTRPAAPTRASAHIEAPAAQPQDILHKTVVPRRFDIVGVRTLDFSRIAAEFVPLAGRSVTVADIVAAANRITALYKEAGYALSYAFVPNQSFRDGIVQVDVVEGYIAHLDFSGATGKSRKRLQELAAPLLAEKPLRTATFDRQTLLMARLPGISVNATAPAPTTTDGATTLHIKTRYRPVDVSVGADVRQPVSRAIAGLTLNDPFFGGDQLQLSTLLRPLHEERLLSVSYRATLDTHGDSVHAAYSDYRGVGQQVPEIPGIGDVIVQRRFDASITHPLQLSAHGLSTIEGGLYAIDYRRTDTAFATGRELSQSQRFGALFARFDWSRSGAKFSRNVSLMLAQGLNGTGARAERSTNFGLVLPPDPARLGFTRLTLDASERHRFGDSGWGAAVALGGQISPDVLPIPERISFGGSRFGRAYQPGEIAGDSGLGVSVELNHIFNASTRWLKHWAPYLLLEKARVWEHTAISPGAALRSASLGIRFDDGRHYWADVAVSKPLDATVDNPRRAVRISLLLTYKLDGG